MPRDTKTVLGWAPLQPVSKVQGAALPHPSFSQPVEVLPPMPPMLPMPPVRTIQPRRQRQPRPVVHHPLPIYRESPLTPPPVEQILLPPVLPDPAPQPASSQHIAASAGSEAAALTLLDLPIIDDLDEDDATDPDPTRARPLRLASLHLLGAILLHVAGLLADGDPEVQVEAQVALYSSVALMIWCLVLIFRRARA